MKRYEAEDFLGDYKSGHWDSLDAYLCTDVDALLAQCEEALNSVDEIGHADSQLILDKVSAALTAIRAARTP